MKFPVASEQGGDRLVNSEPGERRPADHETPPAPEGRAINIPRAPEDAARPGTP